MNCARTSICLNNNDRYCTSSVFCLNSVSILNGKTSEGRSEAEAGHMTQI